MPRVEDLPSDLKDLAGYQAIELSDARWDYDVERLITAIGTFIGPKRSRRLVKLGLVKRTEASGTYDRLTVLGVREAQRRFGLAPDTTCGQNTADALGIADWPTV